MAQVRQGQGRARGTRAGRGRDRQRVEFVTRAAGQDKQVIEREDVVNQFVLVTTELEGALDNVSFGLLDISDEVREQVDLLRSQLKRAKGRVDIQDQDLHDDVLVVLCQDSDKAVSSAATLRLAERLNLRTLPEIRQETCALNRIIAGNGGGKGSRLGDMSALLTHLKDFVLNESDMVDCENTNLESEYFNTSLIPDDFRCPISLELMQDPVIVATGQTYERACIQKWLDAGNKTCPKTQQVLSHLIVTPNYVLKSLIAQWCEMHGVELPIQYPSGERQIELLLQKLSLGQPDVQRAAAAELRMLAKKNSANRIYIAEAGAIPHLVELLFSQDSCTQEHAVTALLNLSIYEGNKKTIIASGAIHPIVEVLKNGSMEARENAAATLFSLSVVDENKVAIGASGAIPALVKLLSDGTLRGKKDAATALFNLSIYQGNKARAVRAHVIPPLMQLLRDPSSEMVDESLAILAILATHQEGRTAMSQASLIPYLVELIKSGSPRNKENAAAVLLALCSNDSVQLALVRKLGAQGPLIDLEQDGTLRARRKAASLLDIMKKSGMSQSS
ncbi:hypothetical protein L7F22_051876 [Adiantum nelumboides]|nr:hypothetical protein [Adiantum nelumboides]